MVADYRGGNRNDGRHMLIVFVLETMVFSKHLFPSSCDKNIYMDKSEDKRRYRIDCILIKSKFRNHCNDS